MLKLLLLVVVVGVVAAWLMSRSASRRSREQGGNGGKADGSHPAATQRPAPDAKPAEMLACTHCGVHLPRPDAQFDAVGRPFCSPEHRVAGPR